jgi:hypothetical protein
MYSLLAEEMLNHWDRGEAFTTTRNRVDDDFVGEHAIRF